MSPAAAPTPAPAFTEDPPSPARVLVERQLGLLTRLADVGMQIAEAAGRRAVAALEESDAGDPGEATLAYDRAARAVRMTIALQARLLNDLPDLEKAHDRALSENTNDRINRVHRLVKRAVDADLDGPWDWRQAQAVRERLRDRDDYGPILKLPLAEAVARICKDLGIEPDWDELLVEGWEEMEQPTESVATTAPPQSPLGDGGGGSARIRAETEGAEGRCRPP